MEDFSCALTAGISGSAQTEVCEQNTAAAVGSGALPVFGTPMLLALMEEAACNALAGRLPAGMTTVGVQMALLHSAPTVCGQKVRAEATLEAIDGRKLTFSCEAADAGGRIGTATQTRCIVDAACFMAQAEKRGMSAACAAHPVSS